MSAITLTLTRDELLMLQDAVDDFGISQTAHVDKPLVELQRRLHALTGEGMPPARPLFLVRR